MPKASPQQFTFNGGELSPLMLGRQDAERYRRGLLRCRNAVPLVQGAWTRRPGTIYVHTAKFPERQVRLIPFAFSADDAFPLEFGHEYIRFFPQGGILADPPFEVFATVGSPAVFTTEPAHNFSPGDRVIFQAPPGQPGPSRVVGVEAVVEAVLPGSSFTARSVVTGEMLELTIEGGGGLIVDTLVSRIFEIASPYQEEDLPQLQYLQSADVLLLFHPNYAPKQLRRVGELQWELSTFPLNDGPYGPLSPPETTLVLSGSSTEPLATFNRPDDINDGLGLLPTDEGRLLRVLDDEGWWTWYVIQEVLSSLTANLERFGPAPQSTTVDAFRLGVWSDTTGWPATGTFYEDRLVLAGAPTLALRGDGSRNGRYSDFAPTDADGTVADDHAVSFVLSSGQVNDVQWMVADQKGLLVGTRGGEWLVSSSALNEPLSPRNITARELSQHGAASIPAVRMGNTALFVQRAARKLRELVYVFEVDGFRSPDISALAEHLTRPRLLAPLAVMRQPQPVIWARTSAGALLSITYDREQDTVAWAAHDVGGAVEDICVTPSVCGACDEAWLVVRRSVQGNEVRALEFLGKLWEEGDGQLEAVYLDSAATSVVVPLTITPGDSPPTDVPVASGLMHLEGQEVNVWLNGGRHPNATVEFGRIFLEGPLERYEGALVTVGLPYRSEGVTMPMEAGAADGSAQGKTKRINRFGLWLQDTGALAVGSPEHPGDRIPLKFWSGQWSVAPPLFTGVVRETFSGDFDLLGQVSWEAEGPAPATVLALMAQLVTEDGS